MANVVTHPHLQVPFAHNPLNHTPAPLGFGFGLTAAGMWASTPTTLSPSPWSFPSPQPQPSSMRAAKRRHEPEDDAESRDEAMDRSPTPERPKRAVPKRARTTPTVITAGKDEKTGKENKPPADDVDDVDVGILLASLPSESLLPLLTSLLSVQPSLKSTVLSLIPRPTLDTALQALAKSAKKLRDAYPYSNSPFSQASSSTAWGVGSGFGNGQPQSTSTGWGFGRSPSTPTFSPPQAPTNGGGMRDEYILSRLRPHITDFVHACLAYLPYFSYATVADEPGPSAKSQHQSHASALQSQHKDKSHPSETFLYLSALTNHFLAQPPLAQSALGPLLLPRLTQEWRAWVGRVDDVVNRQGGMFGEETVRGWERGLDEWAHAKGHGIEAMRDIRNQWVQKVGWLVGRQRSQPMDEEF